MTSPATSIGGQADRSKPAQTNASPPAPLIAPTGNATVNTVVDVINSTAAPFMNAPPPEQGAAGWVSQGLGGVLGVLGAPQMIIDTAFAALTAPLAKLFPSLPAMTLGAIHIGWPHAHLHPPSFIPPVPPIPLPSIGVTLGSGAITVLVGGLPAARAGDIGLAITCGSLAPPFEIFTGSSNVFIGGARAARILDITQHCNPMSMGPFAIAMGAAGVVAGAAGAIATGNAYAAAQAAADAAVLALKLLCGKDPGIPPSWGALVGPPVPNVLIGGFPCPPIGDMAVGGLMKLLKKLASAVKSMRNSRKGNAHCADGSEPIYLPTGENFNTFTDFVSGGLLEWKRHVTSARAKFHGPMGRGFRHFLQRSLSVRLHRAVFTDWDGEQIHFPRFEQGSDTVRGDGHVLRRLAPGRYRVSYRGKPAMEFAGGEFDGELPLVKLIGDEHELALHYDRAGQLSACTETRLSGSEAWRRWEFTRDSAGHIVEIAEVGGVEVGRSGQRLLRAAYQYDEQGRLLKALDALSGIWAYEYDAFHRITKQTDPRGYFYTFKYDVWGRCTEASGMDGLWACKVQYFPEKKYTRYTEGDNATWEYHYDNDGFVTKIVDPYGGVEIRERDNEGQIVCERDSGGRVLRFLYDHNGAHCARIDDYGNIYPPEFDMPRRPPRVTHDVPNTPLERQYGGLTRVSFLALLGAPPEMLHFIPEGLQEWARGIFRWRAPGEESAPPTFRRVYDELGRLIREVDPAGRIRQWCYDATGNMITSIDRDGQATQQQVTSWNLIGEIVNPIGQSLRYSYSKVEQVTGLTDPLDNTTRYDYDKKERLVRVYRNGQPRDERVYDSGGHLTEKRDGYGQLLFKNTRYDNHLVGMRVLSSGNIHYFDYDRRGRITKASTNLHEILCRCDWFGQRTLDLRDGLGIHHRYTWNDKVGSKQRVTTILARFSIVEEIEPDGSVTITGPANDITRLHFDASQMIARRASNGTLEVAQYDDEGKLAMRIACRPVGNSNHHGWSTQYSYTMEGDLIRIEDNSRGITLFEFDAAHRLVREITPAGQQLVYDLDAADNILSKPGLTRSYVGRGNRITSTDDYWFEYNSRDHISVREARNGSVTRYIYDSLDMLVQIERVGADGRELPVIRYSYDALGRRIAAISGQIKEFYWDGDRLAAEVLPDGKLRIYTYAGHEALVPIGFTDYATSDADPGSGVSYVVFSDQIGMPLHIEDGRGQVVWWANRVDPYGTIEVHPSSLIEYNLRWPGHYFDTETGLHYNRYRYFDPGLGRYLQCDPIGYAGSDINLYGYSPNPLVHVDVLGLAHSNRRKKGEAGTDGEADVTVRPTEKGETSPVTGKKVKGADQVVEISVDGEVVARYYLDDQGRTIHAEAKLDPPASYKKEGVSHVMPEGFESGRDHRGHLVPERSAASQDAVNVPENVIAEHGTESNLSNKRTWENKAHDFAEENPGSWSTHTPVYDGDNPRPTSVTHSVYDTEGNEVEGMTQNIPNPK